MESRESMSRIGPDVVGICVRAVRVVCALAVVGLSLVMAPMASATVSSFTWAGDAAESSWSAPKNWVGETVPSSPGPVTLDFPQVPSCTSACYESKNNVSDLNVESIGIDDGNEYELEGNEVTLGSGGLTASPASGTSGPAGDFIGLPIALGASQAWPIGGRGSGAVGEVGVYLGGDVSGPGKDLTFDIYDGPAIYLRNDIETEFLAFDGGDPSEAGVFNGFVALLGAELNASDDEPVQLGDVLMLGSGTTGPLIVNGSELDVGNGYPAGGIQAQNVTLDAGSEVGFTITGDGTVSGTDYSQLTSGGAVRLGDSSVDVVVRSTSTTPCPELVTGHTYTFVSTTGGLSGSFGNVSEGADIPIVFANGCARQTSKDLQIAYHESGGTQTVTATVIETGGVELPQPIQHYNPYERPNAEGAEWGRISGERAIAEYWAAQHAAEAAAKERQALIERQDAASMLASPPTSNITVQRDRTALVKLDCTGSAAGQSCAGRLTLSIQAASKGKSRSHTVTIATAQFSVGAGKTATVHVDLNRVGRALLRADHGRLGAHLTILQSAPAAHTQIRSVRLIGQKPGRPGR